MALPALNLVIDVSSKKLVQSFVSTAAGVLPTFAAADTYAVELRLVRASGGDAPFEDIDLADHVARVRIGKLAGKASTGSWRVAYGGEKSAILPHNATATQVQTALNNLSGISSVGKVTVYLASVGVYVVTFNSEGARAEMTADVTGLFPTSTTRVERKQTGDANHHEVVMIAIQSAPAAFAELTPGASTVTATVSTPDDVFNPVSYVRNFAFYPLPVSGTYKLAINGDETGDIPYDDDGTAIGAELTTLGVTYSEVDADPNVNGERLLESINFTGSSFPPYVQVITDDLEGPPVMKGELAFTEETVTELLNGTQSVSGLTFEVELRNTVSETSRTVLQASCTILSNLASP